VGSMSTVWPAASTAPVSGSRVAVGTDVVAAGPRSAVLAGSGVEVATGMESAPGVAGSKEGEVAVTLFHVISCVNGSVGMVAPVRGPVGMPEVVLDDVGQVQRHASDVEAVAEGQEVPTRGAVRLVPEGQCVVRVAQHGHDRR